MYLPICMLLWQYHFVATFLMTKFKSVHLGPITTYNPEKPPCWDLIDHSYKIGQWLSARFPLGIKMSIVTVLHPTSSPAECTKASQFQTMQASFLAKIEIQKVSIWPNTIHNPQQVYATFQTFNASSNQSTQFTQPISMQLALWNTRRDTLAGTFPSIVYRHVMQLHW